MRYAPEQEIPLPPMQDGEGARIFSTTQTKYKKICMQNGLTKPAILERTIET